MTNQKGRRLLLAALLAAPVLLIADEGSRNGSRFQAQASHSQGTDGAAPIGVDPSGLTGLVQRDTFDRGIVRVLQAHCQSCHHEGDIAPFPLVSYRDAYEHREAIREMTSSRRMPPWHMAPSCEAFQHDASLTDDEIRSFSRWVATGAPEGDPKDLPPPLTFTGGWKLGTPDLVLTMPESYTPDLSKGDVYRCFVLPTNQTEDHWVGGVEVKPGSRKMVHHVLLFVDPGTSSVDKDNAEPGPGYACFGGPGFDLTTPGASGLGGWAPGARPQVLPDGVGMLLPKNSRVVMQVHYSARAGVTEPDATSVGLAFSKTPVAKRYRNLPLVNTRFRIPAGASGYKVNAFFSYIPVGVHILGITPHMHLLGQTMQVWMTTASGASVCLADVPDWDFNWQGTYAYEAPIAIGFGDGLALEATYDNSEGNPENPNSPPRDVTWGEQTTDEMCLAFIGFTVDSENLTVAPETAGYGPADFGLSPDGR